MSKEEAELLIKNWYEYKLMWWADDAGKDKHLIEKAMSVLGKDRVEEIINNLRKIWNED